MERFKSRLEILNDRKRKHGIRPTGVSTSAPNDAEETAISDKSTPTNGIDAGALSQSGLMASGGSESPSTPEPDYSQSRDSERTPDRHFSDQPPALEEQQRVDPPAAKDRSFMHSIFAGAANDFIQSYTKHLSPVRSQPIEPTTENDTSSDHLSRDQGNSKEQQHAEEPMSPDQFEEESQEPVGTSFEPTHDISIPTLSGTKLKYVCEGLSKSSFSEDGKGFKSRIESSEDEDESQEEEDTFSSEDEDESLNEETESPSKEVEAWPKEPDEKGFNSLSESSEDKNESQEEEDTSSSRGEDEPLNEETESPSEDGVASLPKESESPVERKAQPSLKMSPSKDEGGHAEETRMPNRKEDVDSSTVESECLVTEDHVAHESLAHVPTPLEWKEPEDSVEQSSRPEEPQEKPKEAELSTDSCADDVAAAMVAIGRPKPQVSRDIQSTSWAGYKSLPSGLFAGLSPDTAPEDVYIHDKLYSWIPAKVLGSQKGYAVVAIDAPQWWQESTVLHTNDKLSAETLHASMKSVPKGDVSRICSSYGIPRSQLRRVQFSDYPDGHLPLQNKGEGKRDMADLMELHSAAILYNLKSRHYRQQPYTRVGDIVVAMNPFSWIKELYEPSTRDLYAKNLIWEATQENEVNVAELTEKQSIYDRLGFEPHVYEVSSLAYKGLATTGQDQTILVTGESGAGKTETVKIVMNHLATVQQTRPGGVPTEHSTAKETVTRVLQSSPVFEAFGNAKTIRNENSSRFGKFTQLQFEVEPTASANTAGRTIPYTDLVGSNCTTYLLEKNRVVFHSEGERTYHIFYQFLAAPRAVKGKIWGPLADCSAHDFFYTSGVVGSEEEDGNTWQETVQALEIFGFKRDTLKTLLRTLVVVLQLGNLRFSDHPEKEDHKTIIENPAELDRLSEVIGIDRADLEETMTSRLLKTPGQEDIKISLTPQIAKESCDALAKEIYAAVFDLLVGKINSYTAFPEPLRKNSVLIGHISLLDIFGFERFDVNRFEQLCINYANERLHSRYIVDNFNEVKEEYDEEGVDLYDFKLIDNSDILSMLEGTPGLISALNEECLRPKGNAATFVYKAKLQFKGNNILIDEKLHRKCEFGIRHFTGPVDYNAEEFVERNMDKLPDGLLECAARSENHLIREEFKALLANRSSEGLDNKASNKAKKTANRNVLQKFQTQLKSLVNAMEGTKTRYIRCIKPNSSMKPRETHHQGTLQQLECSGLMTALTISRESFPNKLPYSFILNRYACLMLEKDFKDIQGMELKNKVERILTKWLKPLAKKSRNGTRIMPFACGRTKVFFKAGAQDRLEEQRMQYFRSSAVVLQTWARKIAAVRSLTHTKACTVVVQSFSRMLIARSKYSRQRSAATKASAWIRGRWCVALLQYMRHEMATLRLQAVARGRLARYSFIKCRGATMVIQKAVRLYKRKVDLRAEMNRMLEQARREITSPDVPSPTNGSKGGSFLPMIEETFNMFRSEIAALRAEKVDLAEKLETSETARRDVEGKAGSMDTTVAALKQRVEQLLQENKGLRVQMSAYQEESVASVKKLEKGREDLEQKLGKAEKTLKEATSLHAAEVNKLTVSLEESQKYYKFQEAAASSNVHKLESGKAELEGKLLAAEKALEDAKTSHSTKVSQLAMALEEQQQEAEGKHALEQELLLWKEKVDNQKRKMSAEMESTQDSHRQQLASIVETSEQALEDAKTSHSIKVSQLTMALEEQQQEAEGKHALEQELLLWKEKVDHQKRKMSAEVESTQNSHRQHLASIVETLEATHLKRQKEIETINKELVSFQQKKDEEIQRLQAQVKSMEVASFSSGSSFASHHSSHLQKMRQQAIGSPRSTDHHEEPNLDRDRQIARLEQEVSVLKSQKKESLRKLRAAVDTQFLQNQLGREMEARSQASTQFQTVIRSLQSLVAESSALPAYINKKEMKRILEQQERGEKMAEKLDILSHLHSMEGQSQSKKSQASLALVEEFIAIAEPSLVVRNLKQKLANAEAETSQLRDQIRHRVSHR